MNTDAYQIFADYAKASGLRDTTQRSLILDAFLKSNGHVSVDDLYQILNKSYRQVGYATVHRTMKLIAESGLAREVMFNDGISRYERTLNAPHHHHLICNKCGKVIEFSSKTMDREEKRIAGKYDFEIESHQFKILGICKECRKKKRL